MEKTKSKDNDKAQWIQKITKHEGTSLQRRQRQTSQELNDKSNLIDLMKECHNELTSGEIVSLKILSRTMEVKQLVLEMLVDESLEMIVDESLDMIVDESFDMIVNESLDMIMDESLMVEDKSLEKLVDETLKLDEEHFESVIADYWEPMLRNDRGRENYYHDSGYPSTGTCALRALAGALKYHSILSIKTITNLSDMVCTHRFIAFGTFHLEEVIPESTLKASSQALLVVLNGDAVVLYPLTTPEKLPKAYRLVAGPENSGFDSAI
ncbi:hypothetical protein Tco_0781696 [Tanacetum coccineum]